MGTQASQLDAERLSVVWNRYEGRFRVEMWDVQPANPMATQLRFTPACRPPKGDGPYHRLDLRPADVLVFQMDTGRRCVSVCFLLTDRPQATAGDLVADFLAAFWTDRRNMFPRNPSDRMWQWEGTVYWLLPYGTAKDCIAFGPWAMDPDQADYFRPEFVDGWSVRWNEVREGAKTARFAVVPTAEGNGFYGSRFRVFVAWDGEAAWTMKEFLWALLRQCRPPPTTHQER